MKYMIQQYRLCKTFKTRFHMFICFFFCDEMLHHKKQGIKKEKNKLMSNVEYVGKGQFLVTKT